MSLPDKSLDRLLELAERYEIGSIDSRLLDDESASLLNELQLLQEYVRRADGQSQADPTFDVTDLLKRLRSPVQAERVEDVQTRSFDGDDFPHSIGDYEIQGLLGHGGSSSVFRGRHRLLGTEVAIKSLEDASNPKKIARFKREMRLLGALCSPHIVRVLDARIVDGRHYLIMELIDGQTVGEVSAFHFPLRLADACEVVRQVCVGLRVAHKCGVIHRDIKPSNVMLERGGRAVILDLGLASLRLSDEGLYSGDTALSSLTSPSHLLGTIDFIAPEQIEDARRATAASDIYSLGCFFFFVLTGQPPFSKDEYPADLIRLMAHQVAKPEPISSYRHDVPSAVEALMASMLEKSPHARPVSLSGVANELEPFCRGADLNRLTLN